MQLPKPQPREPGRPVPEFRFSPNRNRAREIRWRGWSAEAFEQAKRERKPILLAISAVWCHWCHVMDETSYSDERNIRLINERYIPIRVDADKRPDIQNRYLLGGWPTTAVLTDTGEVVTGGTYIPINQLRNLLQRTSDYYRDYYDQLKEESEQKRGQIIAIQSREPDVNYEVNRNAVAEVMENLQRSFDSKYGGFGEETKFPNPPAIELLLRRAFLEDEAYLLEMAAITLDNMAEGGLMDKIWGGFFRYSTERDWSKPHYEKLLSDNAELIIAYLHGYQVSDFTRYRDIAEKTLGFVDSFFADKEHGGFFGSQDANEEFYKLSAEGRLKAKIPYIDPIIYIDANAAMVSAYIEAYKILGDNGYLSFAKKTVDFLIENCFSKDNGMAHYYDGSPHYLGWLSDQVHMIGALVDTYGVTGDHAYLGIAKELADICNRLYKAQDGTFFDRALAGDEPELGALFVKNKPLHENVLLARQIYRLAYINGVDRYEKLAEQILANVELAPLAPTPAVSLYGLAVDEVAVEPVILKVVGHRDETGARALLKEVWRRYIPGKEVVTLDPVEDYRFLEEQGFPPERHPVIYPCIGRMCLPAAETVHELSAILEDLPGRPK